AADRLMRLRKRKRALRGAPFFAGRRSGLALPPGRFTLPGGIARRQRHAGFEPLELDAGARAGAQQPIGGLAQSRAARRRIFGERHIKRRQERGDVAVDPGTQLAVDKSPGALSALLRLGVAATEAGVTAIGMHWRSDGWRGV